MIEENENEEEVAVSISDSLGEAWDSSEGEDNGTEQQGGEVHQPSGESDNTAGLSEGGSGDNDDKSSVSEKWVRSGQEDEASVNNGAEINEKPPVGLSLEAREAWKDVPDSVKADIVKREHDYASGIQKHRVNSDRAQAMDRSLAPFQQYFAMNGGAGATLQNLLQTGSMLQMGTPQQKAQMVSNIINQYGIDIKALDSMLVGEAPSPQMQQQTAVQQAVQQAVQPYQQHMAQQQQYQQQHQQLAQNQVAQEVTTFGAQHEFYNDVRGDMADLLDMAANRGREMSMDEAYNFACAQHPQISQISNARTSQQQVNKKRQAASSIHGSPGGSMTPSPKNSIAAALNDAWDNAGQM